MWLSRDDILRLAPPSLQKELRGEDSAEDDASPKRIGGITASPIKHPRCPKCGSTLLFNGSLVWCTFIGSSTEKACDFGIGIHRNITRSEATALWWRSLDIGQRLTDDQIAMFRGSVPPIEEVSSKVEGLIVGQKLTDDQVAMLFGNPPTEEVEPKVDGSITVEIVEATERRPERVALGFYNVDHHIDVEQAIALAKDILRKTGNENGHVALWQRLAEQKESTRMWKERADCMVELVNAALAVADSIKLWEGGKTATASPPLCADLIELAAIYASKATGEIWSSQPE